VRKAGDIDAVRAALAMRAALADYNRELEREGLPTLKIGVGVHRGSGLAGLIGSRERMAWALGAESIDEVVARIEEVIKMAPVVRACRRASATTNAWFDEPYAAAVT